jgi:hypothetical protein
MIIAVDFDNTLAFTPDYPEIGDPNRELIKKIKFFQKDGAKIMLFTSRSGKNLKDALEWCAKQGLEFGEVVVKPRADIYIDDRALRPEEWL